MNHPSLDVQFSPKFIENFILRMIVLAEIRNWLNSKVPVCVQYGLAGLRMEYAVATTHFKTANKILSEIVIQPSTMTRRMGKNGA